MHSGSREFNNRPNPSELGSWGHAGPEHACELSEQLCLCFPNFTEYSNDPVSFEASQCPGHTAGQLNENPMVGDKHQ